MNVTKTQAAARIQSELENLKRAQDLLGYSIGVLRTTTGTSQERKQLEHSLKELKVAAHRLRGKASLSICDLTPTARAQFVPPTSEFEGVVPL